MYTANNDCAITEVGSADKNILDIGCGTGSTAMEIRQRFPDVRITGINIQVDELNIARPFLDVAIQGDLNQPEALKLDDKYDLIICSHVLEHLIDPKSLLSRLESSLADDGRILVIVPNFGIWHARVQILFGNFEYRDSGLMDRTHLRFFTYHNLISELVPSNLLVKSRLASGHFPLPILRRFLPKPLSATIDSAAVKWLPNLFSSEIGLTLKR